MEYKVAFLIGSESDRKIAEASIDYFKYFNIKLDLLVMSAHRNPKEVSEFEKPPVAIVVIEWQMLSKIDIPNIQ